MDLFDIGIVVLGWVALATFVCAFAVAAGRADRRMPRLRTPDARESTAEPVAVARPRTFERRSGGDRRVRQRVPTPIH